MFCWFGAGGGVCEQALHECAWWCVLEAASKAEERGGKDVADFLWGGD